MAASSKATWRSAPTCCSRAQPPSIVAAIAVAIHVLVLIDCPQGVHAVSLSTLRAPAHARTNLPGSVGWRVRDGVATDPAQREYWQQNPCRLPTRASTSTRV